MATYDTLGATYARTRRPDRRIAAQIHAALANVTDVINIGAGTGSYEPPQTVLASNPARSCWPSARPDPRSPCRRSQNASPCVTMPPTPSWHS
ncbi:hypothetical protein ACIBJF_10355 [Streptomyces sp. NPDC050743]|uniref:hypothetical protein n=1 Tax=Streptomyces sp. NPDC050743 TaxID=3365634 RepID=UPI0037B3841D